MDKAERKKYLAAWWKANAQRIRDKRKKLRQNPEFAAHEAARVERWAKANPERRRATFQKSSKTYRTRQALRELEALKLQHAQEKAAQQAEARRIGYFGKPILQVG